MLARAHDLLDGFNADIGHAACQYCSAEGYDGDGLRHNEDCIIALLRREITMAQIPTIGRVVHYRHNQNDGRSGGACRPAIIVHVWSIGSETGSCQLQVFNDSDKDAQFNDALPPIEWKTSIAQGSDFSQFHFYEDCPNKG